MSRRREGLLIASFKQAQLEVQQAVIDAAKATVDARRSRRRRASPLQEET